MVELAVRTAFLALERPLWCLSRDILRGIGGRRCGSKVSVMRSSLIGHGIGVLGVRKLAGRVGEREGPVKS